MALVVLKVGRTVGFAFCSLILYTVHTQSQLEKACAATKHSTGFGGFSAQLVAPQPPSHKFTCVRSAKNARKCGPQTACAP